MDVRERFERAQLVREMYPEFVDFCRDAMEYLGYSMTWMQEDIAEFMQYGPQRSMVAAQRGEAKSTIACLFGLWNLVQDPTHRVVLISGAQDKAEENGKLMHGLIHNWPLLQYLAPDKYAGDRTSVLEFDVHWSLKGVDKSASVNCLGITSSLQGYRGDLLISDDIETTKNGLTATERAKLITLSKEFTSIVADRNGRILYLGTPQTRESIYNTLPGRGFTVRVWPGRFPKASELPKYGDALAPSILERMALLGDRCQTGRGLDGTRGWSTDPERYSEEELCDKELDQGPETFELQFMLNTSLSDAARQQLKLRDLIVADFSHEQVPESVFWAADPRFKIDLPQEFPVQSVEMFRPASVHEHFAQIKSVTLFLDPAGNGGDELAFAIGGAVGPYIHVVAWGGFKGGVSEDNLDKLVQLCKDFGVKVVLVEKNMGAGTVTQLVRNHFLGIGPDGKQRLAGVGVDERQKTGQKELRIINTIRPVMQKHRLVLHRSAVEMDLELLKQYPLQHRDVRSGLYQMHNITSDRGSLTKDDRLDALEGLVAELMGFLVIDEVKEQQRRDAAVVQEFLRNPMGTGPGVGRPLKSGHRVMRKRFGR